VDRGAVADTVVSSAIVSPTAEEIIRAAAHWIDRGIRLDTRTFAHELGISRSTLFRRVGNREETDHVREHQREQAAH